MTPENTIREFFEFFDRGDAAVQVVPLTIQQQADDTQLAIFIQGEHEAASVIMAGLMLKIEELFDMQAQMEAPGEPEPSIIAP